MDLLEGLDVFLGDAVVGGGDTNICFLVSQLELEVSACFVLTCDLNALNCYEHRLSFNKSSLVESSSLGVSLGVVNGSNFLNGLIGDSNRCVYDLVQTVVGVLNAGYVNGHTNLDAQISGGIVGQVVNVVAAFVVGILQVQTVGAGAV